MSLHPHSISVTNLQHTIPMMMRHEWEPVEVTVATDLETVALIKDAHRLATENSTAGVIPAVDASDFKMTFLNYDKEEVEVADASFVVRVTADTLYIELFGDRMELSSPVEPLTIAAFIRVTCSLKGIID